MARQVRGRALVAKVLEGTLAEIARVGLEHLSVEEVARRVRVNKTTIYRRWPTPGALARAALVFAAEADLAVPDTGALQSDLHAFAREFGRMLDQSDIQTLLRMRWGGGGRDSLANLMRDVQRKKHARWKIVVRRAVARGELKSRAEADLLYDVTVGTLLYLTVYGPDRSSVPRLIRAVDAILDGFLVR